MFVIFDTVNVYYIPQFQPIFEELKRKGHQVALVCYKNKNKRDSFESILKQLDIQYYWVEDDKSAAQQYQKLKPDWIFFGKGFNYLDQVHQYSKSVQIGHGVGPKPSYYHKSSTPMTVRFMEGKMRLDKIRILYPNDKFVQVGFSKLDPMFNGTEPGLDYKLLGLSNEKPTILYAPTFNPSSLERFPDKWPQDFSGYNILIKPHTFTYTRAQYAGQRKKLAKWAECDNVYLAKEDELSLLPFMKNADILLSEASSTLFEFAALDKPVIVCDFFKLKWSYRGIFKSRFEKRFGKDNVLYKDIGRHVASYKELRVAIEQQLANPQEYSDRRKQYTFDHVGPTDGQSAARIVEYLESCHD
jgi:CDP-glycerol glycerophosphotransferase (TagB/SpsB family)